MRSFWRERSVARRREGPPDLAVLPPRLTVAGEAFLDLSRGSDVLPEGMERLRAMTVVSVLSADFKAYCDELTWADHDDYPLLCVRWK